MAKKSTPKKATVKRAVATTSRKSDSELFEIGDIANNKKVEAQYSELETFIDAHDNIHSDAKIHIHKMVESWKDKFDLKKDLFVNQQEFKTAVGWVNMYLQNINK